MSLSKDLNWRLATDISINFIQELNDFTMCFKENHFIQPFIWISSHTQNFRSYTLTSSFHPSFIQSQASTYIELPTFCTLSLESIWPWEGFNWQVTEDERFRSPVGNIIISKLLCFSDVLLCFSSGYYYTQSLQWHFISQ